MNTEYLIIANELQEVIYIGCNAMDYIDILRKEPFGYPQGHIEKGDIIFMIEKKTAETESKNDLIALTLKSAQNQEITPVDVNISEEALERGFVQVFGGFEFSVSKDADSFSGDNKKECQVRVKASTAEFMLESDWRQFLVIVSCGGTKYFSSLKSEIDRVLSDGIINPHVEKRASYGSIEQLFGKEIANRLSEIMNFQVILINGKAVGVKKNIITVGREPLILYYFLNQKNAISEILEKDTQLKEIKKFDAPDYYSSFHFWGTDEKIMKIERLLQKSCRTNTTILLTGESGTGKTFLAREIHRRSHRADKPFVHINCAAIPFELLESELFGYERGAFTGARKEGKSGLFDEAYGGTLFLDEIAELPLILQGKLLEVIQSRTYFKVGGTKKLTADVRLIVATNKNLSELVKGKNFREDLYYRINVFPIELPPLRERKNSIRGIVADILPEVCNRLGIEPVTVSYGAMNKIKEYFWPGNIRELENVLEKAAILCEGGIILSDDVALDELSDIYFEPKTLREIKENCEKEAITAALQLFRGDKIKAAAYLEIGRTAIFEKIRKYDIMC